MIIKCITWLLAAIVIICASLIGARKWHSNPVTYDDWKCAAATIKREAVGESVAFKVVDSASAEVMARLTGSVDLLCDSPRLKIWDVNRDGIKDLYFQHCGGHGYLACHGKAVRFVKLPDSAMAFKNHWYYLIHGDSYKTRTYVVLFLASIALVVVVAMAWWRRTVRKRFLGVQ